MKSIVSYNYQFFSILTFIPKKWGEITSLEKWERILTNVWWQKPIQTCCPFAEQAELLRSEIFQSTFHFHLTKNILNGQFSGNFSGQFFYDFLAFYSMPRIFTRCTLLIQQDLNLKSFQQFWANQYMKNYHALFTSELWMLWQGEKSNWHTCDNNKRWIQKRTSFLEPSYISS